MEITVNMNLTEPEVKYWIEYAVLNGWKRPRSWSKTERVAAVMYGLGHHLGCIAHVTEVCYAAQEAAE